MKALAAFAILSLTLSAILGGAAPLGRVLLAAGLPSAAAKVFSDPYWRGVALYRAGEFAQAVEAFEAAGASYNRGNALVRLGEYAAALEAYDLALVHDDPEARTNFELVAAFYASLALDPDALILMPQRQKGPKVESFVARGNARAAGTGDEANNTMLGLAELDSRGRLGVRRIFDDKFVIADKRWLAQLADVPGEFLKARLQKEHKRRLKAGLSPPPMEDTR